MNAEGHGIVYILVNESMPGYVKVGFTELALIDRIKGLDNTSVPLPFECFYAAKVENCKKVELLVHDAFADQRVRNNREFFEISPERVKSALLLVEIENVTPRESQLIESNEDKNAISKKRKREKSVDFDMIGIKPGTVLTFSKDHDYTCKVVGKKKVEFEGQNLSVSAAALEVLKKLGYEWQTVNGWSQWCIDGEVLTDYIANLKSDL